MPDLTRDADIVAINLRETSEALYMVIEGFEDESFIPKDSDSTDERVRAIALINRIPMYLSALYVILRDLRRQSEDLTTAVRDSLKAEKEETSDAG